MSRLTEAEILRLNCPGFGQQSFLTQGCARPLHEYRAVVINPVSIIHLFDKDPELILEVEAHSLDGMTSYQAKSDKVLDSIMLDLEMRMVELVQLIEDGGLVVYFLCPPFELRDASNTIDNYYWLGEFAPDKPAGRGDRNMSAAARGRVKEVTEAGTESEFASYFNQSGLQWTTIIRRENLTEGYSMLATAGPNKCVAGQMETGRNKGRLVFLPAPYSAEYDRRLVECLNLWLSVRSEPVAVASTSPLSDDSQTVPVAEEPVEETTSQEQPAAVTGESEPGETAGDSDSATLVEASSQLEVSPESLDTDLHPKAEGELVDSEAERKADDGAFNGSSQPKAEELMSKIGKISRSATPDWCQSFSFDYLDRRRSELSGLEETLRATEEMIKQTKDKISTMWSLKNALLWAEGDELIHAVSHVLERLGWQVKLANSDRCLLYTSPSPRD